MWLDPEFSAQGQDWRHKSPRIALTFSPADDGKAMCPNHVPRGPIQSCDTAPSCRNEDKCSEVSLKIYFINLRGVTFRYVTRPRYENFPQFYYLGKLPSKMVINFQYFRIMMSHHPQMCLSLQLQ